MPDASGNFKGQGWSAARAAGWERVFGPRRPRECIHRVPWSEDCDSCAEGLDEEGRDADRDTTTPPA